MDHRWESAIPNPRSVVSQSWRMACPKRHLGAVAEVPRVSGGVYCHGDRYWLVTVRCAHFAVAADDPVHSLAIIPDSKTQASRYGVDIPTERNPVILRDYPETFYSLGCLFSVMKFRLRHRAQTMEH